MFKTTVKSLLARKLRLFTTGIAVLLGVAFMSGTLVLTDTIGRTFDNVFAAANKGTDAYVRGSDHIKGEMGDTRNRVDEGVLRTVLAAPGVKTAEGSVQGYTQLIDKKGKAIGNPNQGHPGQDSPRPTSRQDGGPERDGQDLHQPRHPDQRRPRDGAPFLRQSAREPRPCGFVGVVAGMAPLAVADRDAIEVAAVPDQIGRGRQRLS